MNAVGCFSIGLTDALDEVCDERIHVMDRARGKAIDGRRRETVGIEWPRTDCMLRRPGRARMALRPRAAKVNLV